MVENLCLSLSGQRLGLKQKSIIDLGLKQKSIIDYHRVGRLETEFYQTNAKGQISIELHSSTSYID